MSRGAVDAQRWWEKVVRRSVLGGGPLPVDATSRAVYLQDGAVIRDGVPAKIFEQDDDADKAVVTPTPHFCATEQGGPFLAVANLPDDRGDDAPLILTRPEGAVGFAAGDPGGTILG